MTDGSFLSRNRMEIVIAMTLLLSTGSVTELIRTGKIRYFYLAGGSDSQDGAGNSGVTLWISSHCSPVNASDYRDTGAGNITSGISMPGAGPQDGSTLYDCHTVTA